MAEDKTKKPEELQDEQLDEVNGGVDWILDGYDQGGMPGFGS